MPYINREMSWLHFNMRVLQEAQDKSNPLLERLKFLGIFSNNLDEFYRVRIATLRRMIDLKVEAHKKTYDNPENILEETTNYIKNVLLPQFTSIYEKILEELAAHNIFIVNEKQLDDTQAAFVKAYFDEKVHPNLFPLMLNTPHELNELKDKSVYLAVFMEKSGEKTKKNYALVKVPASILGRFLVLPEKDGKKYIIILDDIIRYCIDDVFSMLDYDTLKAYTIKFSRDAELDIDNDVDKTLLEKIAEGLKQRKRGKPVRFVYDREIPESLLNIILKKLKVTKRDRIVAGDRYHNFKDFMNFPDLGMKKLVFSPLKQLEHPDLSDQPSIFKAIRRKDVMLHFPYHSFMHIINLLREASIDPKVVEVKMTLYRVAKNSNVINSLINAARNGKSVTVFLELQARFDEEANIYWSKVLSEEGVKVLHGKPGFKVHSKLILIRRKEKNGVINYANIGTGNFNEQTARVYTDISLLTAKQDIATEVESVFNLFETNYSFEQFNKLVVSPFSLRSEITKLINREIKQARQHKKAHIILKLNSLVDKKIINKLYEASMAGVKIQIIARGICVLVPGVKNVSENIEAVSIVGRFLEHTRIYYFYNGGDEKFLISSADLMTRNIDHRIEVTCPVLDKNIQKQLLDILNIQLKDNTKARLLNLNSYNFYKKEEQAKKVNAQKATYKYFKQA